MKRVDHVFPVNQYYQETYKKKQIVLHHTVSGTGVSGDINWWEKTKARVATCVIISRDGTFHTLFNSKHWAHHLGIKRHHFGLFGMPDKNRKLNQQSIGVELDSWGGLVIKNGKFYSYTGEEIPRDRVQYYNNEYRGYKAFEKYTKEQIASLKYLLQYWNKHYQIPLKYKGDEIFSFNERALKGEAGVWTHTSFRPDKSDCHPQPELISMLKSL